MEQVSKKQRNEMLKTQHDMQQTRRRLNELQATGHKLGQTERSKKLFVHPERPLDLKGFEERVKAYHERRNERLTQLKDVEKEKYAKMFKPEIDPTSAELTKNKPHFQDTIDDIIKKSKEKAPQKGNHKVGGELPEDSAANEFPSKIRDQTVKEVNSKMYDKNVEWKREKDDKVFEQQVAQNLIREKVPHFKPAMNYNKNAKLVKDTFDDRRVEHPLKVKAKIEQLADRVYDFPFEPKVLYPSK